MIRISVEPEYNENEGAATVVRYIRVLAISKFKPSYVKENT